MFETKLQQARFHCCHGDEFCTHLQFLTCVTCANTSCFYLLHILILDFQTEKKCLTLYGLYLIYKYDFFYFIYKYKDS